MQRKEIIQLAEKLGLLYPEVDYNHPQHQRLISKLEKFAEECHSRGYAEALRDIENQIS